MSNARRQEEILGAFGAFRDARLREKRILLIDDVTTTGATLAEAKRTLRQAGGKWIGAAVLAKTSRLPEIAQGVDPGMTPL
jgi:predicted amidophosphoribosyltransferase